MIRESVLVFDQICLSLSKLSFPSNLTRPSKQYEIMRRMSYELFLIRHELLDQISARVLNNHPDVQHMMARLDHLAQTRLEIRMLGDEFSPNPPYFSSYVKQLTHLLDLYTSNSLTQLSFYDQLSRLPEQFIILGSAIAHEYETREVPQYSRFDSDYFSWPYTGRRYALNSPEGDNNATNSKSADARQSNMSFFGKLFS